MNDALNPYDSPSGQSGVAESAFPRTKVRALWMAVVLATLLLVSDWLVYSNPTKTGHTQSQITLQISGFLLAAICSGVGFYGSLRYSQRFLAPAMFAFLVFVSWVMLLINPPT